MDERVIIKGRSCRIIDSASPTISQISSTPNGRIKCSFASTKEGTRSLKFVVRSYLPDCNNIKFSIDDLTDINTVRELRASVVYLLREQNPKVSTASFDIIHTTFPSPRLEGQQGIETVFSSNDDDRQLYEFGFFENEERTYRLCLVQSQSFQIIGTNGSVLYNQDTVPSVSDIATKLSSPYLYTAKGRLILNSQWGDLKTFVDSLLFFLRIEELGDGPVLRLYSQTTEDPTSNMLHVYVRTRFNARRLIPALDTSMPLCLIAHKLRLRTALADDISGSRNRLIFNGVQLPKSGTVQECRIKPGNQLFSVPILCGVPDYHDIVTVMGSKDGDKMSDFNQSYNYSDSTSIGFGLLKREFSDDENSLSYSGGPNNSIGSRPLAFI